MITFQDIMTREIIYYDKKYQDECRAFCQARGIERLPAVESHQHYYAYANDTQHFKRFPLSNSDTVHPRMDIFAPGVLEKFKQHKILFVTEHNRLLGVVHFCDYNRPSVYNEIYQRLFHLERGLIRLISDFGMQTVADLELFMAGVPKEYVANSLPLEKDPQKRTRLTTFQDFSKARLSLKAIMQFAVEKDILKIANTTAISRLRNKIAHSDDLVSLYANSDKWLRYDIGSFKKLLDGKAALETCIKQIGNRAYLMKAHLEDNYSLNVSDVHREIFA